MLPHLPWEHLPSGSRYNDRREVPGLVREDFWGPDEGLVAAAYYRLLLQTQALDALTGELFERLRDLGVFEEAMVILTSDHGASFRPDASRRGELGEDLRDEILPIPLFIKLPGQTAGAVHDDATELVDVLPTILAVLGVEQPPWPVDGRNLLSPASRPRATRRTRLEHPYQEVVYPTDDPLPLARVAREKAGLLAIAAPPEIVGAPLDEARALLYGGASLEQSGPLAGLVHAHLRGELEGTEQVSEIAVGVNGIVRSVGPT